MSEHTVPWRKFTTHLVINVLMLVALSIGYEAHAFAGPYAGAKTLSRNKGPGNEELVLDSTITILETPDTPEPILRATQDLASDFQKVLGRKPRLISREQDAGPVTILIGEQSKLPEDMHPANLTAPESFSQQRTGTRLVPAK